MVLEIENNADGINLFINNERPVAWWELEDGLEMVYGEGRNGPDEASRYFKNVSWRIYGNVILVKRVEDDDTWASLTEAEVKKYLEVFALKNDHED